MRIARWLVVCMCCGYIALAQAVPAAQWWLSAGVFRTDTAAEAQRKTLSAQGVETVRIVDVPRGGETLHRVVVGPYADSRAAHAALVSLRRNVQDAFALQLAAEASPISSQSAAVQTPPLPEPQSEGTAPPEGNVHLSQSLAIGTVTPSPPEVGSAHRGITLSEYLRRNGGNTPVAPAVAPPGYQLNRLHRGNSTAPSGQQEAGTDVHDVTPAPHPNNVRPETSVAEPSSLHDANASRCTVVRVVRNFCAAIWQFIVG